MEEDVGDQPHHMLKLTPENKGTFLPQLNPLYTGRYCQHVTLYSNDSRSRDCNVIDDFPGCEY